MFLASVPLLAIDVVCAGSGKALVKSLNKLILKRLSVRVQVTFISHFIRKNTVTVQTPNVKYFYDLRGLAHRGVKTPHLQRALPNTDHGGVTRLNKVRKWVESATQQDIRTVKNILKRR